MTLTPRGRGAVLPRESSLVGGCVVGFDSAATGDFLSGGSFLSDSCFGESFAVAGAGTLVGEVLGMTGSELTDETKLTPFSEFTAVSGAMVFPRVPL